MNCKYCHAVCQKAGRQRNGAQKLYCKACRKYQQSDYRYAGCRANILSIIPKLICESVGIRGIARILKISTSTVIRKIKWIAGRITKPPIPFQRPVFELDELRTYIKKKENEYWVAYAICGDTKQVVDFTVGKRNKRVLGSIVHALLISGVKTIKTDKLNIYRSLIPASRHISNAYNINHIERNNLNLRTHLKRLSRRTICFSRSLGMLESCLRIYFWYASYPGGEAFNSSK